MTEKRGRIAHVLAEARASLLEPSRPLTPEKLNSRATSLNIPAYDAMMEWSHDADKRLINEINAEMQSSRIGATMKKNQYHAEEEFQTPQYGHVKENMTAGTHTHTYMRSSGSSGGGGGTPVSDVSMSPTRPEFGSPPGAKASPVLDLMDQCAAVLSERLSRASVVEQVQTIGSVVDRFAKQVGSGLLFDSSPEAPGDIYAAGHTFTLALLGVADDVTVDAINAKCLACRHALRVQQALLSSSRVNKYQEDIIANIHHATCLLYGIHQDVQELRGDTDEAVSGGGGGGGGGSSVGGDDGHLHEAVDCLLEFLDMLWMRLPNDLERELLLLKKVGDATAESSRQGKMLEHLLTSASYAASILRMYSSKEVNRRRLLLLSVVKTMTSGLDTVGKHAGAFADQKAEKEKVTKPAVMNIFRADLMGETKESAEQEKARARIMELLCTLSVQTVTVLRNFSLDSHGRKELIKCRSICALCQLMRPFHATPELVLSCARALAKLSLSEAFRQQINSKPVYSVCIAEVLEREGALARARIRDPAQDWPQWYSLSLLSRICFVLGNLTTSNAESRSRIMTEGKGLAALVDLILYSNMSLSEFSKQDFLLFDTAVQDRELELCDVSVKLLRLLANVSIAPDVGKELAGREDVLTFLRNILRISIVAEGSPLGDEPEPKRLKRKAIYEELLLNALAVITNISFHLFAGTVQETSPFDTILVGMMDCVGACLFYDHGEILTEATRAMGNLTRCRSVAAYTVKKGYADALMVLLGHNNFDIQTASAGALVNISTSRADRDSCSFLRDTDATVTTFVRVLRRASFNYFQLSILVCRILANLLYASGTARLADTATKQALPSLNALEETLKELCESTRELQEEAAASCDDYSGELHLYAAFLDVSTPILRQLQ
jgi:hypothetical protein